MRSYVRFLPLAVLSIACTASAASTTSGYAVDAMSGVRLVYGDELAALAKIPPGQRFDDWPRQLPRSIHAVAAGSQTVLALTRESCADVTGEYQPSHCGDGQLVVIALSKLPEVGEVVALTDDRYVTSGLFLGDLLGTRGSGCLGFPTRLRIERVPSETSDQGISLSIEAEFESEMPRDGEFCGTVPIEGRFVFHPKELDDFVDGGVRYLFGCDGDVNFAARCARGPLSR